MYSPDETSIGAVMLFSKQKKPRVYARGFISQSLAARLKFFAYSPVRARGLADGLL